MGDGSSEYIGVCIVLVALKKLRLTSIYCTKINFHDYYGS